ncbi:MAG: M20/M25/M40 family metallo-hydrolase [Bacteroidales bacterium]|nr:M20/M25/M40 family metallo-hydrolase [Bacteroidales bacterium]
MTRLQEATALLQRLIATPSLSRDESAAADIVEQTLRDAGVEVNRLHNNVWVLNRHYRPELPTVLLNSHLDTVKPAPSYSRDPFKPEVIDGHLYGLGSNDAGASGVSLLYTFLDLYEARELPFNLLLALTAEEEVMGEHGMRAFLPAIADKGLAIDMAIVGEPTSLQPAVAERGLVVLDCVAHGVAGHAARNEGVNALYLAIEDIERLRRFKAEKVSEVLGPLHITVTQIEAGRQHNVVPDSCKFVVDVRTTDAYTNQETVDLLRSILTSEANPRSTRVQASVLSHDHPLYRAAVACGGKPYVSPTTSDMAIMHGLPSLKIGPGESSRSHTADEYILLSEIADALAFYPRLLTHLHF